MTLETYDTPHIDSTSIYNTPNNGRFKIGDTVEYISDFSPWLEGKTGEVVKVDEYDIVIQFDDEKRTYGVLPDNIRKLSGIVPEELFEL